MMTNVYFGLIERWVESQQQAGHVLFSITELTTAMTHLFPSYKVGRRMVYQISQQYAAIFNVKPQWRARRNFKEQLFTPEQAVHILTGVQLWQESGRSYVEVFTEMRATLGGAGLSESIRPASSGLRSEGGGEQQAQLMTLLEDLRTEVRALRHEVSELQQDGQRSSSMDPELVVVSRSELRQMLWRCAMGVVSLSLESTPEQVAKVMAYLEVPVPTYEVEVLQAQGLSEPFELD